MEYEIRAETFARLRSCWEDPGLALAWDTLFVVPGWLEAWWTIFGAGYEPYLYSVRQDDKIIGIAPLVRSGETVRFMGSTDICDYLDFVVAPRRENDFYSALLDDLEQRGIHQLDLMSVRGDSTVINHLTPLAQARRYEVKLEPEDVSLELALPGTWDEYLAALSTKHRHEVERKLRKLYQSGRVDYRNLKADGSAGGPLDDFIRLFTASRKDKAIFMTPPMLSFFRSLAENMARDDLLRFAVLDLDAFPVAMLMAFDYQETTYLYNSGYDPRYRPLSAGLVSKVLCVKDAIERRRRCFNFLKGGERYKYYLGGQEVPIYRCHIVLKHEKK